MTTIGIIGAGNIGSNVAQAAIAAGHDVVIANSRGPESLSELVSQLGPQARAATVAEAATAGELVLVAIPLKSIGHLPVEPLTGKIVMDANNYYPQRDGRIDALDTNASTTSELLQQHLPAARVVKAFNNIPARQIVTDGKPGGTLDRRALPVYGDDAAAKDAVIALLDEIGFDGIDLGALEDSWRVERDTPTYVTYTTADELRRGVAETERVSQS